MSSTTNIEYCDSTVNGQMGCDGCELWSKKVRNCYAGRITEAMNGNRKGFPARFESPQIFDGRIQEACKWEDLTETKRPGKPWLDWYPRIIFLNDMGDTFTESLPMGWLRPYLPLIEASPHIWLILTKRVSRMVKFFGEMLGYVPGNCWLGASVTGKGTLARANELIKLAGMGTLWLSVEPLLEEIVLPASVMESISWVGGGGESGPGSRPMNPRWAQALRDQCIEYRAPFFFKQWGDWAPGITTRPETSDCHYWSDTPFGWSKRVGKKHAGRLLDGVEWNGLPAYHLHGQLKMF